MAGLGLGEQVEVRASQGQGLHVRAWNILELDLGMAAQQHGYARCL